MLAYNDRGAVTRESNLGDLGPPQDLVHHFILFGHGGAIADALFRAGQEVDMTFKSWCGGCYERDNI
jgi:hypothetical protein